MRISILTPDSLRPNLAAMKISAWHKAQGHEVELNFPLIAADFTYASVLFDYTPLPAADLIGGPVYPDVKLDPEIEAMFPDYSLYPDMDYSIGYTFAACPRTCDFCIVPKQNNSEDHYSIHDFLNPAFNKIELLNNNTLADPYWRDTLQEIMSAGLMLKDNGFDVRLITEESADYLRQIKFEGYLHIAWDFPEHEAEIMRGIGHLQAAGIKKIMCYVLIGHTSQKDDMRRVMALQHIGVDPYVMPLNGKDYYQKHFKRWVNRKPLFKSVLWPAYKGFKTMKAEV